MDDTALEKEFLVELNNYKVSKGLPPIKVGAYLKVGAEKWSSTMAKAKGIFHDWFFFYDFKKPWSLLGENVGSGPNVHAIMEAFINSPGHLLHFLIKYDYVGIGVEQLNNVIYVTMRFRKL